MKFRRFWAVLTMIALLAGSVCTARAEYTNPYYITVDITNQIVTIYNTADSSVARQMICSTGTKNRTPLGTFYMPKVWNLGYDRIDRTEWHFFEEFGNYAKWASRIYNDILFHSVLYDDKNTLNMKSVALLGNQASHGCIRLREEDAYFIAKNCLSGTRVEIFESGEVNENLRMLLKSASYTGQDGLSYEDFCAYSETGLGAGATGSAVSDLQSRLQDLGYLNGVSGVYDLDTISAVRKFQEKLGVHPSGTVEGELSAIIFSDDAPLASDMTALSEGRSGPAVRKFQEALQALGVYEEDIDGVYDLGVIEAVKKFQQICGCPVDGVASQELQHLVYFELDKIKRTLGTDDFEMEVVSEPVMMGTIDSQYRVNVRTRPSQKSDLLGQLTSGYEVMVFGTEEDWARIYVNGVTCYVLRNCVDPHEGTNTYMRYSANGQSVTIGSSLEQLEAGTGASALQELHAYVAEHPEQDYLGEEEEQYVAVNTGDADVALNLRGAASGDGEVLAQIPNDTVLRVISRDDDWTCVGYDDQIGYLMNQYLREAEAEEAGSGEVAIDLPATVISFGSESAPVYNDGSEGATQLGSLPAGTEVEAVSANETGNWVLIRYQGHEGYMRNSNLEFQPI